MGVIFTKRRLWGELSKMFSKHKKPKEPPCDSSGLSLGTPLNKMLEVIHLIYFGIMK